MSGGQESWTVWPGLFALQGQPWSGSREREREGPRSSLSPWPWLAGAQACVTATHSALLSPHAWDLSRPLSTAPLAMTPPSFSPTQSRWGGEVAELGGSVPSRSLGVPAGPLKGTQILVLGARVPSTLLVNAGVSGWQWGGCGADGAHRVGTSQSPQTRVWFSSHLPAQTLLQGPWGCWAWSLCAGDCSPPSCSPRQWPRRGPRDGAECSDRLAAPAGPSPRWRHPPLPARGQGQASAGAGRVGAQDGTCARGSALSSCCPVSLQACMTTVFQCVHFWGWRSLESPPGPGHTRTPEEMTVFQTTMCSILVRTPRGTPGRGLSSQPCVLDTRRPRDGPRAARLVWIC